MRYTVRTIISEKNEELTGRVGISCLRIRQRRRVSGIFTGAALWNSNLSQAGCRDNVYDQEPQNQYLLTATVICL